MFVDNGGGGIVLSRAGEYVYSLNEAKRIVDGWQTVVAKASGAESEKRNKPDGETLASVLSLRGHGGFSDWRYSRWTDCIRSDGSQVSLSLDEAQRFVDGWAASLKGGI